jgi:hypothetical protein
MRMRRLHPFSLFLFGLSLLAACAPAARPAEPEPVQVVRPLVFEVVETSLGRYNPPGAGATLSLSASVRITNPNGFPVRLRAIDYELFLEEHEAGRGSLAQSLALEPFGSDMLSLAFDVDLRGRPTLLRGVADAFAGAPLSFYLEAALELETLGYRARLPRERLLFGSARATQTVRAPLLRFDELESSAFMLEPGVPVVRVVARATNPGEIGYFLYGNELRLILDGELLAFADMPPSPVPAEGSSRVEILFYPDPYRLGASARAALERALAGLEVAVEIRGDLHLDVLGIDTYAVPPEWQLSGRVAARP